jgi:hypothetical protein
MDQLTGNPIDQLTEDELRDIARRAGGIIECAWAVSLIRHKDTGLWSTALYFHDQDHKKFAHSFSFSGSMEIAALIERLFKTQVLADEMNAKGKAL